MSNPHNLRESEDTTNKLNDHEFVTYLIDLRLLNKEQVCSCGKSMTIQTDYSSSDGIAWRCPSSSCRKYKSVKSGSVFENSKYNLRTCFRIYCAWVANFRPIDIAQYVGVNDTHAICRLCQIFREKCSIKYLEDLQKNPLGSTGGIVQVDESATGRAKYNRGRALKRECAWVAGAIDDETNRVAVLQVPDRTQKTLSTFICNSVENQATIHSDCWSGYNNLESLGFNHDTVNHSVEFVKENDDGTVTHTQKMEGNWTSMKKFVNHHNAHHRIYTNSYIQNWAFRRNVGGSFTKCFDVLKKED